MAPSVLRMTPATPELPLPPTVPAADQLTDNLGAKVKGEWTMPDSDSVVEWKYEGSLTYEF